MHIAPLEPKHWPAVRAIYEEGIATGNATFEQEAPDWGRWDAGHHQHSRLVAIENAVIGWAALSSVSQRHVYRGVAEVSLYIAAIARGQGVGRALMNCLIEASEAAGIWTLQSGIFKENDGSIQLHLKAGFRIIGQRERVGQLNGVWRATVLMERRSSKIT